MNKHFPWHDIPTDSARARTSLHALTKSVGTLLLHKDFDNALCLSLIAMGRLRTLAAAHTADELHAYVMLRHSVDNLFSLLHRRN